jgi:prepilin-type N-terminal cleavage/methylation domain-containing protein
MPRAGQRPGMTLVELLVTMGIAVVLLAIALPTIKFTLDSSRVREASRQINTYISGAKARAATTGRPVGIWLERDLTNFNSCSRLFLAEAPQYYAGDAVDGSRLGTETSNQDLSAYLGAGAVAKYRLVHPVPLPMGAMNNNPAQGNNSSLAVLIDKANDPDLIKRLNSRFQIRFNYQGPWFHGIRVDDQFYLYAGGLNGAGGYDESYDLLVTRGAVPPANGAPYQIQRAPRRSDASGLELPRGTAIDLAYSGLGGSGHEMRATSATKIVNGSGTLIGLYPVILMIQPSGSVTEIYVDSKENDLTSTVHLLASRVERIIDYTSDTATMDAPYLFPAETDLSVLRTKYNLFDPENLWVSIGHRSGAVTTVENFPSDSVNTYPAAITQARSVASTHQAKGGQ